MGKHSQFAVRFRLAVVYRMVPNLGEMLDWNTYLREAVSRSPQGFRPSEGPGRPKGMGFAIFDGPRQPSASRHNRDNGPSDQRAGARSHELGATYVDLGQRQRSFGAHAMFNRT